MVGEIGGCESVVLAKLMKSIEALDVLNVVSAHRESRIPCPAFFGIDGEGDLHQGFMYFEGWLLSIGRWDSLTEG